MQRRGLCLKHRSMRISCLLLLLGSLVAVGACTRESPTSPTTIVSPSAFVPQPSPDRTLSIYEFSRALSEPVKYVEGSSYYLYEDKRTFMLIYANDVSFDGTYTRTGDEFAFSFTPHDYSTTLPPPGPWNATGTLDGNELTIRYSTGMKSKNFEDAVYKLLEPRR